MTGNLQSQSFFPPGKVADYTGFQYLRDNDPDNMGHNTSFLTRISYNVLYVLTDSQIAKLKLLASNELSLVQEYGYSRYTLMQAFRHLIDGTGPAASLKLPAVRSVSRTLYNIDGQIAFGRAYLYAEIFNTLTDSQKAYLDAMKGHGFNSWSDVTESMLGNKLVGLQQGTKTLVMTYAGDIFSWYAGDIDADIYFCPERHGTYYGGFYMKDAPAVGHEGYSINEELTATSGSALINNTKGYVTAEQAEVMSSLVGLQRSNLYSGALNMVQLRTEISLLLRQLRVSLVNSEQIKTKVLALSELYGELDGENNYHYASVFTQVYSTLTSEQKQKLMDLRHSILSGAYSDGTPFDFTTGADYYLYSDVISNQSVLSPYFNQALTLF